MRSALPAILLLLIPLAVSGCGGRPEGFRPINPDAAVFWSRQTTESADLLRDLMGEFTAGWTGVPLKIERTGDYGEIFRKVTASIQARALPAMAVAYESMTAEYINAGAVVPLDDFLADPELGISEADLDDFFPAVLETNRYAAQGGKMYSFPFAKSLLVLYYNKRVLAEAGIDAPPATWEAFLAQCRQIKAKTGKKAYALHVDCSTVDGMIYAMGGEVARDGRSLFDSPESLAVFELLATLAKEELAFQITPNSYDDHVAFAGNEIAFMFRSSSHRASIDLLMEGADEAWGIARIPQADPAKPATVLYGPNICIFDVSPEQQRTAWAFTRFFTSTEVSARWSLKTGYLPIRKSAADDPRIQASWAEWEYNRTAFDCMPFARTEPNLRGWQQVRNLVARVETEVLNGLKSPEEAVAELKKEADAILTQSTAS